MKISDLKGFSAEKKYEIPGSGYYERFGYNACLDEVGGLELGVDEEKAIDIIRKMDWYCKSGIPTTNDILETVQKLSSTLPQWLVLKGKL